MIKAPLVKLEKNRCSEALFWVLNGLIFFILWFILFPSMPFSVSPSIDHPKWYYAVSTSMIGIKMFIPYVMAVRKDPGQLKPNHEVNFLDLLQKFDTNELCPGCKVIKTPRARHCTLVLTVICKTYSRKWIIKYKVKESLKQTVWTRNRWGLLVLRLD
jgi:hypothetical protein